MKYILAILSLLRLHNLFIGVFAVLVSFYLLNIPFNTDVIMCMLIVFSSMSLGYIMNDFLDIKSDSINHPNRPLVQGTINDKTIILLSILFSLIIIFSSREINLYAYNLLYIYILPSLVLYNLFLKKTPFVGNLIISLLLGSVFLFTELALAQSYNKLFIIFILTVSFSFTREMIKDLQDYNGDLAVKMKTAPIIMGKFFFILFISFWILFLLIILPFPYYLFNYSLRYLILIIIFIEIPLIYSLFLLIKFPSKRTYKYLADLLKILCLLGLIILMIG